MDEIITPSKHDDPKIPPPPPQATMLIITVISGALLGILALSVVSLVAMNDLQQRYPAPPEYSPDTAMIFVQLFLVLMTLISIGLLAHMGALAVRLRKWRKAAETDTSVLAHDESALGSNSEIQGGEPERHSF